MKTLTIIWKHIEGFENYFISNEGEVLSNKKKNQKMLKGCCNSDGYLQVVLYRNRKRNALLVHRLIGLHFVENPENKPTIDHINQNRTDNSLENLRWATYEEQSKNRGDSKLAINNKLKEKYIHESLRANGVIKYRVEKKSKLVNATFDELRVAIVYRDIFCY